MGRDNTRQTSSQVSGQGISIPIHQHYPHGVHRRGIYKGSYMTLHDIAESIRQPQQRTPTPEELMLIRMIEQLTNAIKSTAVGEGTGISGGDI